MRSPVREIFRRVDLSKICSFAGGYPAAETFPMGKIEELGSTVLRKYGARALQYGATQGIDPLREALSARYGVDVSRIQITTSSQQGIDVCSRIFLDPGDVVLACTPTYLGALQSFCAYRSVVVPLENFIPIEGSISDGRQGSPLAAGSPETPAGTVSGDPEELLSRAKFIYVIPDFSNPSGKTMSLRERELLVGFAREKDLLIIEDCPYRELRYEGEPVPTVYSLAPERTVHLGSFSKILAPGFRLGWIFAPEEILEQIYICKQALDLCPPVFDQYIASEYITGGALDEGLSRSREIYRRRRDTMTGLLEQYMPEGVSWTRPEGGLFLFLTLPESIDTVKMYDRALSLGVAYVAGSFFYPDGSHRNTMRLNFSFIAEERMEEGVRLLSGLVRDEIEK